MPARSQSAIMVEDWLLISLTSWKMKISISFWVDRNILQYLFHFSFFVMGESLFKNNYYIDQYLKQPRNLFEKKIYSIF